jgi:hypothetical protein
VAHILDKTLKKCYHKFQEFLKKKDIISVSPMVILTFVTIILMVSIINGLDFHNVLIKYLNLILIKIKKISSLMIKINKKIKIIIIMSILWKKDHKLFLIFKINLKVLKLLISNDFFLLVYTTTFYLFIYLLLSIFINYFM